MPCGRGRGAQGPTPPWPPLAARGLDRPPAPLRWKSAAGHGCGELPIPRRQAVPSLTAVRSPRKPGHHTAPHRASSSPLRPQRGAPGPGQAPRRPFGRGRLPGHRGRHEDILGERGAARLSGEGVKIDGSVREDPTVVSGKAPITSAADGGGRRPGAPSRAILAGKGRCPGPGPPRPGESARV